MRTLSREKGQESGIESIGEAISCPFDLILLPNDISSLKCHLFFSETPSLQDTLEFLSELPSAKIYMHYGNLLSSVAEQGRQYYVQLFVYSKWCQTHNFGYAYICHKSCTGAHQP